MTQPQTSSVKLNVFDKIISDRGSRYAVSGGRVQDVAEVRAALVELKRNKRFAKATHHTWGARLGGVAHKDDDGEGGAAQIIVQMLERAGLDDHVVVVTRWFGGKHLGGDRFRHVVDAVRIYLAKIAP